MLERVVRCATSASDESFGLHTLLGQRITRSDQTSDANTVAARYWLYGVVEPATGEDFFYSFSHLDGVGFGRFLELLVRRSQIASICYTSTKLALMLPLP